MSQYFTANFYSESGFPSKVAYHEFEIRESKLVEPINKNLLQLVKKGQALVKNLYNENSILIKQYDQERKNTNIQIRNETLKLEFKKQEKYQPIDFSSDDEITSFQPITNITKLENEIKKLVKELKEKDLQIKKLVKESNEKDLQIKKLVQESKEKDFQIETILLEKEERISIVENEVNQLIDDNLNLKTNYKLLRTAFIDLTIEYETLRASAPGPIKRKRI